MRTQMCWRSSRAAGTPGRTPNRVPLRPACVLVNDAEKCKRRDVTMTRADLIGVIAEKLKLPWARAELLVEQVFSSVSGALMRGEGVEVRGFGRFTVRQYRVYEGRNPRTGAIIPVKPKRLAFFKVSKKLRERVNDGRRSTPLSDLMIPRRCKT
jgi:integration host factor subunit beta